MNVSACPEPIAVGLWINEAERWERPSPNRVLRLRVEIARQPRRRTPPRATAYTRANRSGRS